MSNYLDKYSNSYNKDFPYMLDNRLMLPYSADRIMELSEPDSLLELGIGFGMTTVKFSKYFKRHLVIDGSYEMIDRFKKNHIDCSAEIVEAFFEEFDTDERFKTIVMGFVLEHVENPSFILERYKKILKDGGRIFITVPNAESLNRRVALEAGMIDSMDFLSDGDLMVGHRRVFSVEVLKKMIDSCGLNLERVEGIFLKPFTTSQIESLKLSEDILAAMVKMGRNYPELSAALLAEVSL